MKKKRIETSINEFLNIRDLKNATSNSIENLLNKVKNLVPKEKIDKFVEENKGDVEKMRDDITDENGNVDYDKVNSIINRLF